MYQSVLGGRELKIRILVTGGAGFLGSVLVEKLLEKGYEVRVLDNLLYGEKPIKEFLRDRKFELFRGDIRDMIAVIKALRQVDAVIHLASIVGDQAADLEPKTTIQINYMATRNLAELCKLYEIKLLYSSSCSVYGNSPKGIMDENIAIDHFNTNYPKPISLYGETKLKSEKAIQELMSDYVILRLGTLFGLSNRMRFDLAINLFIAKAIKGEKIQVFGGNQYRPFLHVQDAADCFIQAIEDDWHGIFNSAWDNLKIIDVIKTLQNHTPIDFEISSKIVDRRNYRVSCEKIKNMGFNPRRNISDAFNEIKSSFDKGMITDYTLPIHSNYKQLFSSEEIRQRVYILGPIGEMVKENRDRRS